MIQAQNTALELVDIYRSQLKPGKLGRIAVSVEPLFEVYAQIPAALSQLIVMQNQLLKICEFHFDINGNAPSSLNKALKKCLTKFGFSEEVDRLFNHYWRENGEFIRNIRNINEHHSALIDYTFYELLDEKSKITILLPDNPEVKSQNKFTYKNSLDAVQTVIQSFRALDKLVTDLFSIDPKKIELFQPSLSLSQVGELVPGEERTLGLMINILNHVVSETGVKLVLDTIELSQIVPKDGSGNLSVRKLVPDSELDMND